MKYPKIETLYDRDSDFKVMEDQFRLPEFEMIDQWFITEKIDGTNVRIFFQKGEKTVPFVQHLGRTDKAQFHPNLIKYLEETFTKERLKKAFNMDNLGESFLVVLFGEGYGPKIQKGGNYREDISFRLFDIWIQDHSNPLGGWWLEPEAMNEIATKLRILPVPFLGFASTRSITRMVKQGMTSLVSTVEGGNREYIAEGIVARPIPMLFRRNGKRLMFKLKTKDFRSSNQTVKETE